ncbi:MAG TPA: ROK family protein [Candidatus Limnocylindria bacterium]|nr:ROK family protein [Candidatus Limnocylindria bacterium]
MRRVLALDVGGTKIAAGVVSEAGELTGWLREPARSEEGPTPMIERLVLLGRRSAQAAGAALDHLDAVGVGCGGPLDARAGVIQSPPNLPGWVDVPLGPLLRDALGLPVHIDNDANAAVLGEHRFGAGRGATNLVYLTISTGIGGGVIADGRLLWGESGNAAELGHVSVAHDGWPCHCGRRGCPEAFASGTGIARRACEAVEAGERSALAALPGGPAAITAEAVADAARAGDPLATRIWTQTTEVLGAAVANALNAFNPRRVILGGGVTRSGDLLLEPVRRIALSQTLGPQTRDADIVPAELGERTGVLGAAAVALARLEEAAAATGAGRGDVRPVAAGVRR